MTSDTKPGENADVFDRYIAMMWMETNLDRSSFPPATQVYWMLRDALWLADKRATPCVSDWLRLVREAPIEHKGNA